MLAGRDIFDDGRADDQAAEQGGAAIATFHPIRPPTAAAADDAPARYHPSDDALPPPVHPLLARIAAALYPSVQAVGGEL